MGVFDVLKSVDQWNIRVFYAALIALLVAVFVWFFHNWLFEASFFFILSVVCAVLVYRVTSQSERAFTVMLWALFLNFLTLTSIENGLSVPAAGPWFLGFIVGSIAGGYVWRGPRAGTEFKQPKRIRQADGSFTGRRHLAVTNGMCALMLVAIGTAQLVLLSPTVTAGPSLPSPSWQAGLSSASHHRCTSETDSSWLYLSSGLPWRSSGVPPTKWPFRMLGHTAFSPPS
jgi:hypothetical protein